MGAFERRGFNLAYKLKVIKTCESLSNNISQTASIFGLHRRTVRLWCKNKASYSQLNYKMSRFNNSHQERSLYPEIELQLKNWIIERRQSGACVNTVNLRAKSKIIASELGNSNFKASNGWMDKFLKRKKFVLRRVTSSGRDLPKNSPEILRKFIANAAQTVSKSSLSEIYNMDETCIYLDAPGIYFDLV